MDRLACQVFGKYILFYQWLLQLKTKFLDGNEEKSESQTENLIDKKFQEMDDKNWQYAFRSETDVFTDISIDADGKKITLAKGSPANGFSETGKIKTRPFDFELSPSQIEAIVKSKKAKLLFTTAQTYNDRAYLNGTIWDVKGGEPIQYNDVSVFKERKEQIVDEGEVKTFEVEVKDKLKSRLQELYEIQQILIRNKVKPVEK